MVPELVFLLFVLSAECSSEVLFFPRVPRIEPAKLEINGFALENADGGLIVDEKDISRESNQAVEEVESRRFSFKGVGSSEAAQRFLGFGLFGPVNQRLLYKGRTQTIFETTTKTSVVLPSCILCTCALNAAGDGTQCGGGVDVPGYAAVCGAGPAVGPVPPVCPASSKKRRSSDEEFLIHERESINPSRILEVVPSEEARLWGPRSPASFPVHSSFEERQPGTRGRGFDNDGGFQYVVKSTLTVITTVTGTLTAQIQIGTLNCLPQYLSTAPYCTSVGK